jgi:hypothetical protein
VRGQAFLAGAFFAVDFLAGAFLAVDFVAVDFFAGAFFAVLEAALDFFAGAFFAVLFVAVLFFVAVFAGAFVAVDFFAVLEAAPDFVAGAFFAVDVDFFAGAFVAVDFAAVDFFAVAFFAVLAELDFEAADFAGALPVAFFAAPAALPGAATAAEATARTLGGLGMVAAVSLGSFFAPEMTFFRSAPGVNFGTDFFFDFIRSPVWGLRTQRALRTCFSKDPKPVMATFSPRATSRVMTSRTESSACEACFLLPS